MPRGDFARGQIASRSGRQVRSMASPSDRCAVVGVADAVSLGNMDE
jgi:hypothetical protein